MTPLAARAERVGQFGSDAGWVDGDEDHFLDAEVAFELLVFGADIGPVRKPGFDVIVYRE